MPLIQNNPLTSASSEMNYTTQGKATDLPGNFHQRTLDFLLLFAWSCSVTELSRAMLASDSLIGGDDHIVFLEVGRADVPVIAVVEIGRHVSRDDMVGDLFLPIRKDRNRRNCLGTQSTVVDEDCYNAPIKVVLQKVGVFMSFVAKTRAIIVKVFPRPYIQSRFSKCCQVARRRILTMASPHNAPLPRTGGVDCGVFVATRMLLKAVLGYKMHNTHYCSRRSRARSDKSHRKY